MQRRDGCIRLDNVTFEFRLSGCLVEIINIAGTSNTIINTTTVCIIIGLYKWNVVMSSDVLFWTPIIHTHTHTLIYIYIYIYI
jgi:hypothetical protein